jgi:hypothetical protein
MGILILFVRVQWLFSMDRIWRFLGLLLATCALFVSAGCVASDTTEQFYPSGHSTAFQQIHIKNMINILDNSGLKPPENFTDDESGWSDYLEHLCKDASENVINTYCHRQGDWLLIEHERFSGPDYIIVSYDAFPYTVHDLTIFKPPIPPIHGLDDVGVYRFPENISFSAGGSKELGQIQASGMTYIYKVKIPGEIIEHNCGLVGPDGLTVDALAQAATGEPVHIKTRDLNTSQLTIIVFGGLFLFLIMDLSAILVTNEWLRRRRAAARKLMSGGSVEAQEAAIFKRQGGLSGYQVYKVGDDKKIKP